MPDWFQQLDSGERIAFAATFIAAVAMVAAIISACAAARSAGAAKLTAENERRMLAMAQEAGAPDLRGQFRFSDHQGAFVLVTNTGGLSANGVSVDVELNNAGESSFIGTQTLGDIDKRKTAEVTLGEWATILPEANRTYRDAVDKRLFTEESG